MRTRRVAVIGGESTGKSTIAVRLAGQINGVIARDVLRDFVSAFRRSPHQAEQSLLFNLQADTIDAAVTHAISLGRHTVIADPDPFMTAVYSQVYFGDDELTQAGLASLRAADAIVWCRPDIPWVSDGPMRDGEEYRALADAVIAELLSGGGLPVICTTGERTTHPAWVPDLSAFLP